MKNHQHINSDSGSDEYYTPSNIIESARIVLGGFDLDPASSETANQTVRATRFFTRADDGLSWAWEGRIWLNHPFGKSTNQPWIAKLVSEYHSGNISEAICICFASTSEKWFRPLLQFPQCFIHGRTHYRLANGQIKQGATKGSVVTYLGKNINRFGEVFSKIGTVKIQWNNH